VLWKSETGCCLLSVLRGLLCLSIGGFLLACLLSAFGIPALVMTVLMHILWSISAFVSGRCAGRHLRRHGLKIGFFSGLLLCTALLAGCLALHEPMTGKLLIRCVLQLMAGMTGGVLGVNTKLKKPPY